MELQTIITSDSGYTTPASVAAAPDLGLTLVADGENLPVLLDRSGITYKCGIDSPANAPVRVSTFTNSLRVCYVYVYAINSLPKVEHTNAAGGKIYPRSNPSPVSAPMDVNYPTANIIEVQPSPDPQITSIFIYRTDGFIDPAEATDAAKAGLLYFVNEVPNTGSAAIRYSDTVEVISGDAVSYDNFKAPLFSNVVYVEPYFYAGGVNKLRANVFLGFGGEVILQGDDRVSEGRNGSVATFDGVTSGGFDGKGRYYFKRNNSEIGQLYSDAALTQLATCQSQGLTTMTLDGVSNVLYRSAPRNPFAWGETDYIGEAILPKMFGVRVGGGRIVSITEIGSSSSLKVDTVEPRKSFTFNLRATTTTDFIQTRKPVNSTISVNSQRAQIEIPVMDELEALVGVDLFTKTFFSTDGTSVRPITAEILQWLRDLTYQTVGDSVHTLYDPRNNMVSFLVAVSSFANFAKVYMSYCFHLPSKTWYRYIAPDINCSLLVFDQTRQDYRLLVGSSFGRIGSLDDRDLGSYCSWWLNPDGYMGPEGLRDISLIMPIAVKIFHGTNEIVTISYSMSPSDFSSMVGLWTYITTGYMTTVGQGVSPSDTVCRYIARIGSVTDQGSGSFRVGLDAIYDLIENKQVTVFPSFNAELFEIFCLGVSHLGANYSYIQKTIPDTDMAKPKRLEIWRSSVEYSLNPVSNFNPVHTSNNIKMEFWLAGKVSGEVDTSAILSTVGLTFDVSPGFSDVGSRRSRRYLTLDPLPIDIVTSYTVSYRVIGYVREQVFRFSLVI